MKAPSPLSPRERGDLIRALSEKVGFDEVGFARAEPLDPGPFERFLSEGLSADMEWLRDERRLDPARILEGARTVVIFLKSYFDPDQPPGWIARYARGSDYHGLLIRRLRRVRKRLHALDPGVRTYGGVDFGLLPEKPWAQRAGLGWIGKNGCLVTRTRGSWVLLASLILDREVEPYSRPHEDFCGSCTRCLTSCPTDAFPRPYVVDARRCISYQTIENRGAIPDELKEGTSSWLFGCDDCQEVCPWNHRFAHPTDERRFRPREDGLWDVPLERLLRMEEDEFVRHSRGTALARPKHYGVLRNALLAAGARRDLSLVPLCEARLSHPHPAVRDAAAWAIERLRDKR